MSARSVVDKVGVYFRGGFGYPIFMAMKKPYLKKIEDIGGIVVWIVDGQFVRKNIDEEFTNFGQHYRFPFIPKGEFWLDREFGPGEQQFFIDHLLVEYRLMTSGMGYDQALEKADAVERRERRKTEFIKEIRSLKKTAIIGDIHKRLLRKYSSRLKVWIIRGELVRGLFFIDFTEGGHDKVYHFVPENEVWLDDDLGPRERKFVLLHELHERFLMSKGWTYSRAHRDASRAEYFCRAHPDKLEASLRQEMSKTRALSPVS